MCSENVIAVRSLVEKIQSMIGRSFKMKWVLHSLTEKQKQAWAEWFRLMLMDDLQKQMLTIFSSDKIMELQL